MRPDPEKESFGSILEGKMSLCHKYWNQEWKAMSLTLLALSLVDRPLVVVIAAVVVVVPMRGAHRKCFISSHL